MGKVVDLGDDLIKAVDLLDHDMVEIFAEIGVVESLGKKLRESFDRDQRVADFVGHAGGEIGPEGGSIDQGLFLTQGFLGRQIEDDGNGATAWNVWYRTTANGGASWSRVARLSDRGSGAPYKTRAGFRFPYGDYFGITVDRRGASYLIWSEGTSYNGPGNTWWAHTRP